MAFVVSNTPFLPILLKKSGDLAASKQLFFVRLPQPPPKLVLSFSFLADFDEQTADDWDVDMSVYYDKGI